MNSGQHDDRCAGNAIATRLHAHTCCAPFVHRCQISRNLLTKLGLEAVGSVTVAILSVTILLSHSFVYVK